MPHSTTQLRLGRADDCDSILAIEELSFLHAGERFEGRRIRNLLSNPRMKVFVAEADQMVMGWSAGFCWMRGREPWGRVYALAVHPEARGRRLGPRLLEKMIEELKQLGARRIFLEVSATNHGAMKLYEGFGFVVCQTLEGYYGRDRPALRMEKK
jgi:[ribosomal protein S18]-alanine N-acetyltransferase